MEVPELKLHYQDLKQEKRSLYNRLNHLNEELKEVENELLSMCKHKWVRIMDGCHDIKEYHCSNCDLSRTSW